MTKTLHGTVRGRVIELDEDPGVADGQAVEVQVTLVCSTRTWGDGILRSAGGWQDHPEMDAIMGRLAHERRIDRRPQLTDE